MSESDWKYVALRDIATDIKDGTHGTHSRVESGVPFLSAKNVGISGRLVWDDGDDAISEEEYRSITSGFSPKTGDLLVTIVGSLGRTAVFQGDKVAFQRSVAFVRPAKDVLPEYLFQASAAPGFALQLEQRSNATAQAGLYLGELAKVRIPLPSEPEQRRIAEILSTLDEAIEQTEALIAKHQQIKAGLMHDLFTRGVTPDGHLRPIREQAPELYKESPLGWVPREWVVEPLGKILRRCSGYLQTGPFGSQLHAHEYQIEGVPVVMPQDINDGVVGTEQIARIDEARAQQLARHRMKFGDIIIARRGDLSRAAAIRDSEQGWVCGTGCFLLRLGQSELDAEFTAYVYRQDCVQRQIAGRAVGTTMPSLNNTVMAGLLFPSVGADEQGRIVNRIQSAERSLRELSGSVSVSRQLKHGLMHDLLTGRVRVKVGETVEA